jgi:hypothetical protein
MPFSGPVQRFVTVVNAGMTALVDAPVIGRLVERYITTISYVGRKSGRTFSLPIGYQRAGDQITIGVSMPDQKSWWRNFLGAGAPMTITLDGGERSGHAVATRDERGRVTVVLRLD